MFYWFFKNKDSNAPLIIWVGGGPNATSMQALFVENGPLRIQKGEGLDDFKLHPAEASWADDYSVMYVDTPADAPANPWFWWFTPPPPPTLKSKSLDLMAFLLKFYQLYPEMASRDLYLAGELQAGILLPYLSYNILDYNSKAAHKAPIPLKGTIIGNPTASPELQQVSQHILPKGLNVLNDLNLDQVSVLEHHCQNAYFKKSEYQNLKCQRIEEYISMVSGKVVPFDMLKFDYDWNPIVHLVSEFFTNSAQKDAIYNALHVEGSVLASLVSSQSQSNEFIGYSLKDYSFIYNELIKKDFPLLVSSGEFGQTSGAAVQEVWMRKFLQVPDSFWTDDRRNYYYLNKAGEDRVGGYYRRHRYFTVITTPQAGLATSNYDALKHQLDDFVKFKELRCIRKSCRVHHHMCMAMKNCNGGGTCLSNGQCQCDRLRKGADCSYTAYDVSNQNLTFVANGNDW